MKKILVLNGSPRKNGNTAQLIDAFTEGAKEAGHEVNTFFIQGMDIKPCIGCMKGGTGPDPVNHPCMQKDDMDIIYPYYKEADIVVFGTPLYYWTFTAQLKMAIDRIYAVIEADGHKVDKKECILLCVAGAKSERNFQPMKQYYESLMDHMGWTDIGQIMAGGATKPGDIKETVFLEEGRKLGLSL